jgi:monoamine oxidase
MSALEAVPLGHAERVGIALSHKIDGLGDHRAGHMLTGAGDEIGLMIHEFDRAELTGYLSGDLARDLGKEGRDAVFAACRNALVHVFGSDIEKQITGWTASQWSGDPLIRGAYSHALPGQAHKRPRLAEPVDERLILAGEATHPTRFASAHGAAMSGLRAASQVMARHSHTSVPG